MFESIQFHPLGNPAADAVGDIGNMIMQARQQQRAAEIERAKMLMQQGNIDADNRRADSQMELQRKQFERTGQTQDEERLRQGAQDFAHIYEAAGKDPAMARQLAKAHGYEIVDSPAGPVAIKKAAPPPNMAQPAQTSGVDAVSGGAPTPGLAPGPNAQWVQGPEGKWVPSPALGGTQPTEPPPFEPQKPSAGLGDGVLPMTQEAAPEAPPATAAENFMARFGIRRKGGPQLDVDPAAAKAAQEEAFAEQLKLKSAAPEQRILATQLENEKKRQFQLDHPELRNEPLTFAEREKLAQINGGFRVSAARTTAAAPLKVDAGNRQDMGALRQSFKQWRDENSLAIDSKTNKRLVTASANLNSGNAMQQREAAESLVSIFKGGGQVTKASQDLLLSHLAGIVGDAQTWVQHLETGHYGADELEVLKNATKSALAEQNDRMRTMYQSAVDTFGPGSGWDNLGGNVNHNVKGEFRQFGLEVPDIYQSAPTVTLGSGERPKPIKKNPIVKAAKAQSLAPVDKQAVDWANAHPNDPRAKAILEHNGM